MRYFKVIYDFAATEAVELSVKKGETVMCSEAIERDGWIKVEVATDTRRKGFVPLSYLKEQSAVVPLSNTTSAQPTPSRMSPPQAKAVATVPSQQQSQGYANDGSTMINTTVVSSNINNANGANMYGGMTPSDYAANPAAVVDAFMKNEVFFKQLMKQRQEALSKMEAALADASADVVSCKDRNAILARKLRDLDQQTEKERRKWKERVEEEKLSIQRAAASAASLYGPGIESRTVRITETIRH